jgi:hypothetical protein
MTRCETGGTAAVVLAALAVASGPAALATQGTGHDALVALHREFRAARQVRAVDGLPTMAARRWRGGKRARGVSDTAGGDRSRRVDAWTTGGLAARAVGDERPGLRARGAAALVARSGRLRGSGDADSLHPPAARGRPRGGVSRAAAERPARRRAGEDQPDRGAARETWPSRSTISNTTTASGTAIRTARCRPRGRSAGTTTSSRS